MIDDLEQVLKNGEIKYFLASYIDLLGVQRAKLIPADAIRDCVANGSGFAGFATWLDMSPADPDLVAMPDPPGLMRLPWLRQVGWLPCDLQVGGKPLAQGPRNVLKRVIAQAERDGFQMMTGVEPEFFLVTEAGTELADKADNRMKSGYDQLALMRRYDVIAEICNAMQALGWKPYQNDHEDANGQFELNWTFGDALVTADRHTFFKFMTQSIAEKHGLRATFMPKPFPELTGSGCHVHVSLWQEGRNLFEDPSDPQGLSRLGYHFIGGLIYSADALTAITNPTVNSYKRINATRTQSGASWSPNMVSYSGNNRTHMIRVPAPGRVEFRLPDGAANPYLLQASILAAGLDGIRQQRDPGKRADFDANAIETGFQANKKLPSNLLDALRALECNSVLNDALGALVFRYLHLKFDEWDRYCAHLTQWERDAYLDC